jgi:hypothetical protein
VQTLTVTGSPTGGTYTLTFDGETTATIAYNATAAEVQVALEALTNIGTGNILCAGGPHPGTPITVTFQNDMGKRNVNQMTANSGGLTGGATPTVTPTTTTPGVAGAVTDPDGGCRSARTSGCSTSAPGSSRRPRRSAPATPTSSSSSAARASGSRSCR